METRCKAVWLVISNGNFVMDVIQIPMLKEVSKLRLQIGKWLPKGHEGLNELNRSIDLGFFEIQIKTQLNCWFTTQQVARKPLKPSLKLLPLACCLQGLDTSISHDVALAFDAVAVTCV